MRLSREPASLVRLGAVLLAVPLALGCEPRVASPTITTDAFPDRIEPYAVQMHVHGHSHHNGDEMPGSMQWHSHYASENDLDVLWWSDHSEMFDLSVPLQVGFESAAAFERRRAGHKSDEGLSLKLVSAPPEDVDWIIRQGGKIPGRANLVVRSQAGSREVSEVVYEVQGPSGRPKGFQLPRPISSGAILALDLRAWAASAEVRIEVRVGLSWHHRAAPQRHMLRYQLSSRARPEDRTLPGDDTVLVIVPVGAERQRVLFDLQEDAALLRDGEDNTITSIEVRLTASRGARASLELFGMELSSRMPEPEHQLAQIRRFASGYASEYGHTQLVGVEFLSRDPQVVHLNALLPEGALTGPLASGDESTWNDPSEFVARVQRLGGLVSLNHMFGTTAAKARPPWQAKLAQRKARELLAKQAYGADLLEVGYTSRGGVGLDYHLRTWDALTARGLFLYGNGVSDTHGGSWGPRMLPNRFATWVWSEGSDAEQLLAGMGKGRMVFGDPFAYQGDFFFTVGDAQMGDRVRVRKEPQVLGIGLDESFDPREHRLFLVQGRIRREAEEVLYLSQVSQVSQARQASKASRASETPWTDHRLELPLDRETLIDVSQPCFVRLELHSREGAPLLFTNPIVFDRKKRLPG